MKVLALLCVLVVMTSLCHGGKADLCTRCKCTKDTTKPASALIDCSQRSFGSLPDREDWPRFMDGDRAVHMILIDFEHNNIQTVTQFPRTKTITALCFRNNRISKIAEAAFINLEHLTALDLSHNELTGEAIRADVFRGAFGNDRYEPLGIVSLNLGFNRIHSLGPKSFEHLVDLEVLYLDNNPLVVVDVATETALASLTSLKVLDLGYTEISDLPDSLMKSMKGLKDLYINGNHFKTVPESLAVLGSSLEKLNLNDVSVTSLDGNSFLGLGRLKQLNISGCPNLEQVLPATFAQLVALESLHLSFNFNLTFISPDAFRELKDHWPVKELFLKQNGLTSLSEELVPWDKLDVLDIQENPWRCDCELQWLAEKIIPLLRRKNPTFLLDIVCESPLELRGEQLMILNSSLLCGSPSDVMRWYRRRGLHIHPFALAMVLLSLGVVLLGLVALCRFYFVKKSNVIVMREVRYTRQVDELADDEYS